MNFMHFERGKKLILCILKGNSPFKMHKNNFFSRTPEKILGVTLNTGIFYLT